jgi:hypothetical protein
LAKGAWLYFTLAVAGSVGVLLIRRWGWRLGMAAPIVGILKIIPDVYWGFALASEPASIANVILWVIGIGLQAVIVMLLLRARRRLVASAV